jgi:low affinity Fe/Cu permease
MKEWFRIFAHNVSEQAGSVWAFSVAVLVVIVWAATGPIFDYSNRWQLVINTGTTIVTFLMVFLIQNTQNRDAKAIHLKLDELLRGVKGARTALVDLEDSSDEELEALKQEFAELHNIYGKKREEIEAVSQRRQKKTKQNKKTQRH